MSWEQIIQWWYSVHVKIRDLYVVTCIISGTWSPTNIRVHFFWLLFVCLYILSSLLLFTTSIFISSPPPPLSITTSTLPLLQRQNISYQVLVGEIDSLTFSILSFDVPNGPFLVEYVPLIVKSPGLRPHMKYNKYPRSHLSHWLLLSHPVSAGLIHPEVYGDFLPIGKVTYSTLQ